MRILAINGSHRGVKGHLGFLIERLFTGARAQGAECEEVVLARHKIQPCLSCGRCHTSEHYLQCIRSEKDDVKDIFSKMKTADLLIYATPVYVFNVSGLMKTFIDRLYSTGDVYKLKITQSKLLFHHIDPDICSKPFVSLICCDNLEASVSKIALSYFRVFSSFMDAPHVGELVRNAGRVVGYGRDLEKLKRFPRMMQAYSAYEQAGQELVRNGYISRSTQMRANQEIIPVPFFGLLKRLKPFKHIMLQKAQEFMI